MQVENIKNMLDELEIEQDLFRYRTQVSRLVYEAEVDELKKAFDNATAEEKRKFERKKHQLFSWIFSQECHLKVEFYHL